MEACVVIIENQNKEILLLRRNFTPLGWCLPGGKVNNIKEGLIKAAIREVFEETGIQLKEHTLTFIKKDVSINGTNVHIFKSNVNNPLIKLSHEHSNYIWINKLLPELSLAGNTALFLNTYTMDGTNLDWEDIIPIGKYKGMIVRSVFIRDMSYLLWLHENTNQKLTNNVLKAIKKEKQNIQDILDAEKWEKICKKSDEKVRNNNLKESVDTPFGKAVYSGQSDIYDLIDEDGNYQHKICSSNMGMWQRGSGYDED